jgi:hypothetical protein
MNNSEAWIKGYLKGYKEITGLIHAYPSMPQIPAGVLDQVEYFYNEGYKKGIEDGLESRRKIS